MNYEDVREYNGGQVDWDRWPISAQRELRRLRSECARVRIQRNEARQELDRLRRAVGRPAGLLTPLQSITACRRDDA
ncbi:MAG: hypothetical protein E6Q56_10130 [Mycobacterium sp.]|nr:MAG: hypothetical protein E6Q56_10130 [Mycobacterium sp.]